jgi:serine/threonine-protein kinase HipA
MVADSLPDDFGNAVMNAWIASQGKQSLDEAQWKERQLYPRRFL